MLEWRREGAVGTRKVYAYKGNIPGMNGLPGTRWQGLILAKEERDYKPPP